MAWSWINQNRYTISREWMEQIQQEEWKKVGGWTSAQNKLIHSKPWLPLWSPKNTKPLVNGHKKAAFFFCDKHELHMLVPNELGKWFPTKSGADVGSSPSYIDTTALHNGFVAAFHVVHNNTDVLLFSDPHGCPWQVDHRTRVSGSSKTYCFHTCFK